MTKVWLEVLRPSNYLAYSTSFWDDDEKKSPN